MSGGFLQIFPDFGINVTSLAQSDYIQIPPLSYCARHPQGAENSVDDEHVTGVFKFLRGFLPIPRMLTSMHLNSQSLMMH